MKEKIIGVLVMVVGFVVSYLLFFRTDISKFLYSFIITSIIGVFIVLYGYYMEYKEIAEMEERFPDFLMALAESLKSGMTLMQAFRHVSKMRLGKLSEKVEKMYYKMSWGIPFPKVMRDFSNKIKSEDLRRAISIILQSYLSGGEMISTLENLAESMKRLREIKKDIQVTLGEQTKVIYTINFLFMVILIIIYNVVIPLQIQAPGESFGLRVEVDVSKYKQLFLIFAVVIGVCSGLLVGVVSEGKLIAGLRHIVTLSAINLLVIGYLFLRKSVNINIEFPAELSFGKNYTIKGIIYIEGKPCEGSFVIPELNVRGEIIGGTFEFNVLFERKGKYILNFIFTCEGEEYRKKVEINVE